MAAPSAIASVMQGTVEQERGKVIEFDSPSGVKWLETVTSFRYEPTGENKPYTARKEKSDYWYGYRKVSGKLHKRYIGKSSELSTAKLEGIAEALNVPPQPRVTEVVTQITEKVTETVTGDRVSALELEVANLRKAVEALQELLPGKSELGDLEESPTVTYNELNTELCNLRDENEALRNELAEAKAENQRGEEAFNELEGEKDDLETYLQEVRSQLETLKAENEALRTNQPSAEIELPEASDILNELRGEKGKSKADLRDIGAILRIIKKFLAHPSQGF